jgi:hypothetical protein
MGWATADASGVRPPAEAEAERGLQEAAAGAALGTGTVAEAGAVPPIVKVCLFLKNKKKIIKKIYLKI